MKVYVEERASFGDNSSFKRELLIRASLEDGDPTDEETIARTVAAARAQIDGWEEQMRDVHYKGVRRGMIAHMLQAIVDGNVQSDELLETVMANTAEILPAAELEVVKREIDFAGQLAAMKSQLQEEQSEPEVQRFRIDPQDQPGYGRRRRT